MTANALAGRWQPIAIEPETLVKRSGPTVFMSYRRRDTAVMAELLFERLRRHLRVFFDLQAIELGTAFMSRIQQALSETDVVLVVIGAHWDPERLWQATDVVAYELRLARLFGRRIIPVVLKPAAVPEPASLPDDLRWLSTLNAFVIPEPPGHSAAMLQLEHVLLDQTPAATSSRTAFAIPQEPGLLLRQEGHIPFRDVDATKDVRLCSIAADARAIWLATHSAVELRDLSDDTPPCTAEERNVLWLHGTRRGAIVATAGIGYHAPDTIRFSRLVCRDGRLDASACGFGWSWDTPAMALSPDEGLLAAYLENPLSGRAHVSFANLDTDDMVEYLRDDLNVSSLTFDSTGERLYTLGQQSSQWQISSINVTSRSVEWSLEVDASLVEGTSAPEIHYWSGQESLLLVGSAHVYELDRAAVLQREVLALKGLGPIIATDRASSLACAVDDSSVTVFSGLSQSVVSLAHGATRALACDVRDGRIVVLVEDRNRRRLLIAEDVQLAADGGRSRID